MAPPKNQRCEVEFHGQVQGVGFRFRASSIAKAYPITGYVLNQRDGSVLLMMEGTREDVSSLTQSVLAAMGPLVTSHQVRWGVATGEFPDFRVRVHP